MPKQLISEKLVKSMLGPTLAIVIAISSSILRLTSLKLYSIVILILFKVMVDLPLSSLMCLDYDENIINSDC